MASGNGALDDVSKGDHVQVQPGERVSVDGVILEGTSELDELSYLAKVYPLCAVGDSVVAGTVNGNGLIVVECVKSALSPRSLKSSRWSSARKAPRRR